MKDWGFAKIFILQYFRGSTGWIIKISNLFVVENEQTLNYNLDYLFIFYFIDIDFPFPITKIQLIGEKSVSKQSYFYLNFS